jgi:hypothetical protein
VIVIGIILLVVGYWLLPLLGAVPIVLITLCTGLGWLALVVGLILLALSIFGHPVGNRQYWY